MLTRQIARILEVGIIGNIIGQDFLRIHGDRYSVANPLLIYAMHITSTAQIKFSEGKQCGLQLKKIAHKRCNRPEFNLHMFVLNIKMKDKRYHSTTKLMGSIW